MLKVPAAYFDRLVKSMSLLPNNSPASRTEQDSFGYVQVPAHRLWGAQTQRSLQNFEISVEKMPKEIIRALAQVKRSAAPWVCWRLIRLRPSSLPQMK
jgi:hypothetical protein